MHSYLGVQGCRFQEPALSRTVAFRKIISHTIFDAAAFFLKLLVIQYVNDIKLPDWKDLIAAKFERMIGERDVHQNVCKYCRA